LSNRIPSSIASTIFVACGAGILLSYAIFWLRYIILEPAIAYDGSVEIAPLIFGDHAVGILRYSAAFLVPMILYVLALVIYPAVPRRLALVTIGVVTVAGPLLLLYTKPILSPDLHDYMMSARILTEYGQNPYVMAAEQFPGDPYYEPVGWKHLPVVYGPVWVLITAVPMIIAGENGALALLLMKSIAIAAHIGTAGLIYLIASDVAPNRAGLAALAYGWNPFPVVFYALDGHNDALMVFFLVGAIYLAIRDRWALAFPVLMLAVLVKYVPLMLFPIFLLAARRYPRQALIGLGASGLLVVATFSPFWIGIDTFQGLREHGERGVGSFAAALSRHYSWDTLRIIGYAVFALGYAITLVWTTSLIHRCFGVMIVYLVAASFWIMPWYFTWPLALSAVMGGPALVVMVLTSAGAFVFKAIFQWAWLIDFIGWQDRWGYFRIEIWMAISLLLPAVLVGLWVLSRRIAEGTSSYLLAYDTNLRQRVDTPYRADN
jgi:alpha-1,6-mannosyltransferase